MMCCGRSSVLLGVVALCTNSVCVVFAASSSLSSPTRYRHSLLDAKINFVLSCCVDRAVLLPVQLIILSTILYEDNSQQQLSFLQSEFQRLLLVSEEDEVTWEDMVSSGLSGEDAQVRNNLERKAPGKWVGHSTLLLCMLPDISTRRNNPIHFLA